MISLIEQAKRFGWALAMIMASAGGISGALAQEADQADQEEAALAEEEGLLSSDELRVVVAPIAFYPDDVLAVVLPASTTGIQVVQAQRFLEKQKSDPSLKPNEEWDPSILALINYPDVIDLMNADLDWTEKLGNAVLDQQGDVMDAIQQARAEAAAAGYLKSDENQTVTQTDEAVVIQSADPEVVYVPQYDPQVVVQQSYASYPPPSYYNPYPPYYSPGATFFAGAVTGAAFAYAFNWGDDDIDVNFNRSENVNINTGDVNLGDGFDSGKFNGDRVRGEGGDKVKWNPKEQRKQRDAASTKRRSNTAAPLGKGTADKSKAQRANTKKRQTGAQAGNQRNKAGLGNVQGNRKTVKESQRGQKSLNRGSGGNLKRQTRSGGNAQLTNRKSGGGGAFGGQASGSRTKAQKNRGQKSLGGRR